MLLRHVAATQRVTWTSILALLEAGGRARPWKTSTSPQTRWVRSGQRLADRAVEEARRREHAGRRQRAPVPRLRPVGMGHVRAGDARLRPESARHPAGRRNRAGTRQPRADVSELRVSPATKLVFKLAYHHARRAGRQTLEVVGPLRRDLRGEPGRAGRDHAPRTASSPRRSSRASRRACATSSARRAAEEAVRAAAVPQALRDEPEPARAPGQAAAGVRPRRTRSSRCSRSSATASAPTP